MQRTDNTTDDRLRIAALKASIVEFTDGPDAALLALGSPSHPVTTRAALGILLRADRYGVATALVRGRVADSKWIDLAVLAHAANGEAEEARQLIEDWEEVFDPVIIRRARAAFAEGLIERWRARYGGAPLLAVQSWDEHDRRLAQTTADVLKPLLLLIQANRRISNDLELSAVVSAVYLSRPLKDDAMLRESVKWLLKYTPIPLIAAELCLRGLAHCPPELPVKLRVENPAEFQAAFLAALLERELFNRSTEAFQAFEEAARLARTEEEKEGSSD